MNKIVNFCFIIFTFAFASCEKDDRAIVLPPPGELTKGEADIGDAYDKQVYISLSTGEQVSRPFRSYDLAFEASATGFHVYLNTGKFMFACRTGSNDMASADTVGNVWYIDNDHLDDDSTGISNTFHNASTPSEVFVIDRGKPEYLFNWNTRLRKLLIKEVNQTSYIIQYSNYNNTDLKTFVIPKDSTYSLMYFSFDNGGQMVQMAPEKSKWDFVFTRYTHTFYEEPVGSPYRHYLVNGGGLNNRWAGVTGVMIKDSLPNYIPFNDFNFSGVANHSFTSNADVIGYGWKEYDFNTSNYVIVPNKYYILKNTLGLYYKIRFVDFYNSLTGVKGYITFEYQRL